MANNTQIVRYQNKRQATRLSEPCEQIQDLSLNRNIKGRGRLIGDQDQRIGSECTRDSDALALPATQVRWPAIKAICGESNLA